MVDKSQRIKSEWIIRLVPGDGGGGGSIPIGLVPSGGHAPLTRRPTRKQEEKEQRNRGADGWIDRGSKGKAMMNTWQ